MSTVPGRGKQQLSEVQEGPRQCRLELDLHSCQGVARIPAAARSDLQSLRVYMSRHKCETNCRAVGSRYKPNGRGWNPSPHGVQLFTATTTCSLGTLNWLLAAEGGLVLS